MKKNSANSKNDNSKERILIELHKTYAQDFQKIEQNYIELIVAVISAISIYGYGLKEFLYKVGECPEQVFILFTITTFGTNILLLIVYFVSNIKGYQARQLQIIVFQIEDALGIVRYNAFDSKNKVIPKKWDPCEKEYIHPPDIYQFFKFISFCLLAGGDLIYFTICFYYYDLLQNISFLILKWAVILIVFLEAFLFLKFRWMPFYFNILFCVIGFLLVILLVLLFFEIDIYALKNFFNETGAILIDSFLLFILFLLLFGIHCKNFLLPRDLISSKSYSEKLKELCEYWFSENEENDNQDC